jgi:hypothetical protein
MQDMMGISQQGAGPQQAPPDLGVMLQALQQAQARQQGFPLPPPESNSFPVGPLPGGPQPQPQTQGPGIIDQAKDWLLNQGSANEFMSQYTPENNPWNTREMQTQPQQQAEPWMPLPQVHSPSGPGSTFIPPPIMSAYREQTPPMPQQPQQSNAKTMPESPGTIGPSQPEGQGFWSGVGQDIQGFGDRVQERARQTYDMFGNIMGIGQNGFAQPFSDEQINNWTDGMGITNSGQNSQAQAALPPPRVQPADEQRAVLKALSQDPGPSDQMISNDPAGRQFDAYPMTEPEGPGMGTNDQMQPAATPSPAPGFRPPTQGGAQAADPVQQIMQQAQDGGGKGGKGGNGMIDMLPYLMIALMGMGGNQDSQMSQMMPMLLAATMGMKDNQNKGSEKAPAKAASPLKETPV